MIPSLHFLSLRRYQKVHAERKKRLSSKQHFAARIALLMLLTVCIALCAFTQERILQYTVSRSGNPVGRLMVRESKQGNQATYKLQSAIKTSFLFTITGRAMEEAIYENGILIYSRFYQRTSGNERMNTEIEAEGKSYTVINNTDAKPLNKYPITYNMVCVYTVEPLRRTRVFADKFQQFVPVEYICPHHYKITFPDGSYNEYYYRAGVCIKVKINATWFDAEMQLKN